MARVLPSIEPLYLYRYRPFGSQAQMAREIRAIRNNCLWCSNFDALNDPMEGSYEASPTLLKHPQYESIKSYIAGQKGALGICSFSETNDNELMWAHYASHFSGICLEYYFPQLKKTLPDDVEFVRLFYNEQTHRVFPSTANSSDIAKKILSTKSHRWLYEREWRMFSRTAGPQSLYGVSCIRHVYIGKRMPSTFVSELRAALDSKGIRYKLMTIDGYSIRFTNPERKRAGGNFK